MLVARLNCGAVKGDHGHRVKAKHRAVMYITEMARGYCSMQRNVQVELSVMGECRVCMQMMS